MDSSKKLLRFVQQKDHFGVDGKDVLRIHSWLRCNTLKYIHARLLWDRTSKRIFCMYHCPGISGRRVSCRLDVRMKCVKGLPVPKTGIRAEGNAFGWAMEQRIQVAANGVKDAYY